MSLNEYVFKYPTKEEHSLGTMPCVPTLHTQHGKSKQHVLCKSELDWLTSTIIAKGVRLLDHEQPIQGGMPSGLLAYGSVP